MKSDYYLKKGDIVICKKTLKRQEGVKFIKNQHCKITDITTYDYEVDFYMFSIITKKDHYNFNDSFFTLKDYRKEKLKKLNESWR